MLIGNVNNKHLFTILDSSTGNRIGSSYVTSDSNCIAAYDITIKGDMVYMIGSCFSSNLYRYNTTSDSMLTILKARNNNFERFANDPNFER